MRPDGPQGRERTAPQASAADIPTVGAPTAAQLHRARELLARLAALRRARRLYPREHPLTIGAARDLLEVIAAYHDEGAEIALAFYDGEVFLGDHLLTEDSVLFDQLIRDIEAVGAGSVSFAHGVTAEELLHLADLVALDPDEARARGGVGALFDQASAPHIGLGVVTVFEVDATEVDDVGAAKAAYAGSLDVLREMDHLVRAGRPLPAARVKGVARTLVDSVARNRAAMLELSALKSYDEYTFYHSVNVAILSLALGSLISRDYRFLSSLAVGALLHDIGKMQIDPAILGKRGPLTSAEWQEMQRHPVYGAELVALTRGLDRAAIVTVLEHHMRYDLAGYPAHPHMRKQHLPSRIVAVADAYDAMTSHRPYSAARLPSHAMALIAQDAGAGLDPALVRSFIRTLGYYPPRSVVRLDTGETAVVVRPGAADPSRPRVRIVADAAGRLVEPTDIDLFAPHARDRAIVDAVDPLRVGLEVADFL